MSGNSALRIVHCVRSPVGGIFRHIGDLAVAQHEAGHSVGIILDSSTGGAFEDEHIKRLEPYLRLGYRRIPMRRQISPTDFLALYRVYQDVRRLDPHILHAHGAKGGAYARIIGTMMRAGGSPVRRLYCPHGGSLHHDAASVRGRLYFILEKALERITDGLVFVSDYERLGYFTKIGYPAAPARLVYNGLRPEEFIPVEAAAEAADFLFIGMLRDLKGPDVFIRAIAALRDRLNIAATALIVGDGPDKASYRDLVRDLGLSDQIEFRDPMPARDAFALARTVVVPSLAESMPYIVLETMAAARPIIATHVGGIPEIFADRENRLIEAGDSDALAHAMSAHLNDPHAAQAEATRDADMIRDRFSQHVMAAGVEDFYRQLIGPDHAVQATDTADAENQALRAKHTVFEIKN